MSSSFSTGSGGVALKASDSWLSISVTLIPIGISTGLFTIMATFKWPLPILGSELVGKSERQDFIISFRLVPNPSDLDSSPVLSNRLSMIFFCANA